MFSSVLIAVVILVVDQATKYLVVRNLALGESVSVIPGILEFTHVRNIGAAFGLFAGQRLLFFGAVVVIVVAFFYLRQEIVRAGPLAVAASGLVLGGAIGNFIDRLKLGYVIDFLDVGFWPVFNIADAGIVVGAIALAVLIIRMEIR